MSSKYAIVCQIWPKSDDFSSRFAIDFEDGGRPPPSWILGVQELVLCKAHFLLVVNGTLNCFVLRKSRFVYAFWRQTDKQMDIEWLDSSNLIIGSYQVQNG